FRPLEQKIRKVFYLDAEKLEGIEDGQRVIARVLRWRSEAGLPDAEIEEIVSQQSLSDLEMKRILIQNGFHIEFPKEVMRECAAIPDEIPKKEIEKRVDFREILTFTIDPADAKDFDDALSFRIVENSDIEVGVHIADVTHYIKKGTALDKEGERRATSVYLPDRVCPMLPERLSNELCSLRPNEDKLTFSTIFTFDSRSLELKDFSITKAIIHSNKRFAYEDVQAILEAKEGLYYNELSTLDKIAKHIRKKRSADGAISFEKPEVRFKLDENGTPIGIYTRERKDAHLLIEDFMLLSNETVAKFGSKLNAGKTPKPFVYRVHDKPDGGKLEQFSEIAKRFGYNVNFTDAEAVSSGLNALLKKIAGKPEQNTLESMAIRCMAKAEYTTKNIGHYGLGMKFYTHFTSPIRRYPDMMVHRLVSDVLNNSDEFASKDELEADCKNSSIMERKAMDAEREATKYKQVEFLQDKIGSEFAGVITGVIARGIFVELVENKCEGFIPGDTLRGDDFLFDEKRMILRGIKTKREFKLGDALNVRVLRADLAGRKIDLELV
ncbi:MAG TPA: ribonuclease R, partial [Chitinophagales bacterium]